MGQRLEQAVYRIEYSNSQHHMIKYSFALVVKAVQI